MRKHRHDFLDVMRHENQRRRIFIRAEPLEELQKMFARRRVQPGARLVQNQHARPGHQRAANQHALPFALRQHAPRTLGQILALDLPQQLAVLVLFRRASAPPEINHRVFAAGDGFQRRFVVGHHLPHGRADKADFFPQLAPVGLAISFAEQEISPLVGIR